MIFLKRKRFFLKAFIFGISFTVLSGCLQNPIHVLVQANILVKIKKKSLNQLNDFFDFEICKDFSKNKSLDLSGHPIWFETTTRRIFENDSPVSISPIWRCNRIYLSGAKGETVSFQAVLGGKKATNPFPVRFGVSLLQGMKTSLEDTTAHTLKPKFYLEHRFHFRHLSGEGVEETATSTSNYYFDYAGAFIDRLVPGDSNKQLYETFKNTVLFSNKGSTKTPFGYPDPLIPLSFPSQVVNFPGSHANINNVFWVSIKIPEHATAGLYKGQISFASTGSPSQQVNVPIIFQVWDIDLPFRGEVGFGSVEGIGERFESFEEYQDYCNSVPGKSCSYSSLKSEYIQYKQKIYKRFMDLGLDPHQVEDPQITIGGVDLDSFVNDQITNGPDLSKFSGNDISIDWDVADAVNDFIIYYYKNRNAPVPPLWIRIRNNLGEVLMTHSSVSFKDRVDLIAEIQKYDPFRIVFQEVLKKYIGHYMSKNQLDYFYYYSVDEPTLPKVSDFSQCKTDLTDPTKISGINQDYLNKLLNANTGLPHVLSTNRLSDLHNFLPEFLKDGVSPDGTIWKGFEQYAKLPSSCHESSLEVAYWAKWIQNYMKVKGKTKKLKIYVSASPADPGRKIFRPYIDLWGSAFAEGSPCQGIDGLSSDSLTSGYYYDIFSCWDQKGGAQQSCKSTSSANASDVTPQPIKNTSKFLFYNGSLTMLSTAEGEILGVRNLPFTIYLQHQKHPELKRWMNWDFGYWDFDFHMQNGHETFGDIWFCPNVLIAGQNINHWGVFFFPGSWSYQNQTLVHSASFPGYQCAFQAGKIELPFLNIPDESISSIRLKALEEGIAITKYAQLLKQQISLGCMVPQGISDLVKPTSISREFDLYSRDPYQNWMIREVLAYYLLKCKKKNLARFKPFEIKIYNPFGLPKSSVPSYTQAQYDFIKSYPYDELNGQTPMDACPKTELGVDYTSSLSSSGSPLTPAAFSICQCYQHLRKVAPTP